MIHNLSRPVPGQREKINFNFILTLICGATKGFMKALRAFIKPFEAPRRSGKIKLKLVFISAQFHEMHGAGRIKKGVSIIKFFLGPLKQKAPLTLIHYFHSVSIEN